MSSSLHDPRTCLNCGAVLTGPYCAECGQPDAETNVTLRGILSELVEDALNWDSRFVTSVRQLLLKPGFLTTEYFKGRRARHVPPFRLFLLGSVLFLAAVGITGSHLVVRSGIRVPAADSASAGSSSELGQVLSFGSGRPGAGTALAATGGGLLGRLERGSKVLNRDPERTKRLWFHSFVWALFLLVPVFALLLRLAFRGAGINYPGHLVFALHLHAVGFLAGAVLLSMTLMPDVVGAVGVLVLLVGLSVYFVMALRTVYAQGRLLIVLKAGGITFVYGLALIATLATISLGMAFLAVRP